MKFIEKRKNGTNGERIVFAKCYFSSSNYKYIFKGIYKYEGLIASGKERIWKKVGERVNISKYFNC